MIVVVCLNVSVFAFCGSNAMEIFNADPLVETVLLDHVIAQVPLAEVCAVVVLADALSDRWAIGR